MVVATDCELLEFCAFTDTDDTRTFTPQAHSGAVARTSSPGHDRQLRSRLSSQPKQPPSHRCPIRHPHNHHQEAIFLNVAEHAINRGAGSLGVRIRRVTVRIRRVTVRILPRIECTPQRCARAAMVGAKVAGCAGSCWHNCGRRFPAREVDAAAHLAHVAVEAHLDLALCALLPCARRLAQGRW